MLPPLDLELLLLPLCSRLSPEICSHKEQLDSDNISHDVHRRPWYKIPFHPGREQYLLIGLPGRCRLSPVPLKRTGCWPHTGHPRRGAKTSGREGLQRRPAWSAGEAWKSHLLNTHFNPGKQSCFPLDRFGGRGQQLSPSDSLWNVSYFISEVVNTQLLEQCSAFPRLGEFWNIYKKKNRKKRKKKKTKENLPFGNWPWP